MSRTPIDGGDLQMLLARDFPKQRSIKEACRAAAHIYGLTPETMRCYASSGVPLRSKAYRKIKARLTEIQLEEAASTDSLEAANKRLLDAIDQQIRAYEASADSLRKLRKTILG